MQGEELKALRLSAGMMQHELAGAIGVTQTILSRWERRRHRSEGSTGQQDASA